MSTSFAGEPFTDPQQLVGRRVNFMLTNGICVIAVRVSSVRDHYGQRSLVYRLPNPAADSVVALASIGHLYVHPRADEAATRFDPSWYVHLGDYSPQQPPKRA